MPEGLRGLLRLALLPLLAIALLLPVLVAGPAHAQIPPSEGGSAPGGPISRSEVLARAEGWYAYEKSLKYDSDQCYLTGIGTIRNDWQGVGGCEQRGYYRTDCSGFVSMALNLGHSYAVVEQGSSLTHPSLLTRIDKSDLLPGDPLVHLDSVHDKRHVQLFDMWTDGSKSSYWAYDFGATPIKHKVYSWDGSWFTPYRYNKIVNDTTVHFLPPGSSVPPDVDVRNIRYSVMKNDDIVQVGGGSSGAGGKFWVDTFAAAPGFQQPGGGGQSGTLNAGTNYVYCRVWGPEARNGSDYNHWWLRTDLDTGSPWQNQYVSALYLSRWGNDVAKDNNGTDIPNCAGGGGGSTGGGKFWVDTFAAAPGYAQAGGGARTGTLNAGTNYVYCRVWGPEARNGSDYNHWWLRTDLDTGSPWQNQYVSALYLSRWGNDVAKDNNGTDIPTC
ncbi:hypothetical protein GCM10020229_80680 [Kitasatospora albolonga]